MADILVVEMLVAAATFHHHFLNILWYTLNLYIFHCWLPADYIIVMILIIVMVIRLENEIVMDTANCSSKVMASYTSR